jgi:signal transduction histidine kinase
MEKEKQTLFKNCEAKRIRLLYGQGFVTQFVGLINVAIFVYVFKDTNSSFELGTWLLVVVGIFLIRTFVQYRFQAAHIKELRPFKPLHHELIFAAFVFMAGVAWGVAGLILINDSIVSQAFFGFLLAGTTAGAAVAYCTSIGTALAFLLPAILPFVIRLALGSGSLRHTMAGLLILYVVVLSVSLIRLSRYVSDSILFSFEKEGLKKKLFDTEASAIESAKMAALGQMAGNIAHEINNPLAIISAYNNQLQKMSSSGEMSQENVNQILEKIDRTVMRMGKIVSGMRVFARVQKDEEPMETVPVHKIISETLDFCLGRFKSNGILLTVDAIPLSLLIECRWIQISQILVNLLNNAFDATQGQAGGAVHIEVCEQNGKTILAVIDNGAGMTPAVREKIMMPFFTTKAIGKGTGLGLSVARNIAQAHGGDLQLDLSSPKTRFVLTLPQSASRHQTAA